MAFSGDQHCKTAYSTFSGNVAPVTNAYHINIVYLEILKTPTVQKYMVKLLNRQSRDVLHELTITFYFNI